MIKHSEILSEFKNEDLKSLASDLLDVIEYMENSSSNMEEHGIERYDAVWISDSLNRTVEKLKKVL